jgi:hypothetical protein
LSSVRLLGLELKPAFAGMSAAVKRICAEGPGRNHHPPVSSSPPLPPDPSNELAMYLQTHRTVRESQM